MFSSPILTLAEVDQIGQVHLKTRGARGFHPPVEFAGHAITTGPDATIVISHGEISSWIDGLPCPALHPFAVLVSRHTEEIKRETMLLPENSVFSIVGRWIAASERGPDLYIPYVAVHLTEFAEMKIVPYTLRIFDTDELSNGIPTILKVHPSERGIQTLHRYAEQEFRRGFARHGSLWTDLYEGTIWYPRSWFGRMPIILSRQTSIRAAAE